MSASQPAHALVRHSFLVPPAPSSKHILASLGCRKLASWGPLCLPQAPVSHELVAPPTSPPPPTPQEGRITGRCVGSGLSQDTLSHAPMPPTPPYPHRPRRSASRGPLCLSTPIRSCWRRRPGRRRRRRRWVHVATVCVGAWCNDPPSAHGKEGGGAEGGWWCIHSVVPSHRPCRQQQNQRTMVLVASWVRCRLTWVHGVG